jgi:hypothetical protein
VFHFQNIHFHFLKFFGEETWEENKNKNLLVALCLVKLWPQVL